MITKKAGNRKLPFDKQRLVNYCKKVSPATPDETINKVIEEIESKQTFKAEDISGLIINTILENIDELNTSGEYEAALFYCQNLYKKASVNRSYDVSQKYGDYRSLLKKLASLGIDDPSILKKYDKEEINQAMSMIDPEKDKLFKYAGVYALATRYNTKGYQKEVYELPQERWMTIAMYLMQDESKEKRMDYVAEAYWAMSNLYMTVATPTMANAGKTHGQLSSCFIDTVDDSLEGIYDSNTDIAQASKYGGGIGVYMGKVRSRGSSIRGYKGASSGVLPWIKQLNNTAVSVDQLGTRQGAIAVYLDAWHKDIMMFLDLKLNSGDERLRAHDIFTGVCLPDLFMEAVEKRADWYLLDPHEVREVMGYSLEDFYDEERGKGSFREKYMECVRNNELSKEVVPAIEIMKRIMKSQLETGTPFMFYRDEVNRMNPNKHEGMIYSSNLCVEINQNMTPTELISKTLDEDVIITYEKPGDFVVCNLSSINLAKAVTDDVLERLIPIQARMLDNVVSLNKYPVLQAKRTSERYRSVGLGTYGWHHLLALKNIQWESDEAVEYADKLYEKIAYLAIKSSMELSKERGAYPLFEGSEWQTGEYFKRRGYFEQENANDWLELHEQIEQHGMRNGYLLAVAPNGSTATIAGTTASIDPVFKPFYHEEKKDSKLPVVAPDLDHSTYEVYQRYAHIIDQRYSVKQNSARQRHIDQSLSFNIYVPNNIRASVLLDLHLQLWKSGGKTSYYLRSTASVIDECEWCHG
ncbi:ribonucleoside-diphosphate reductase subunit alpha [Lederbergia citrisecunda]|uniref:ribonucleoside-diphosphate reductase subunit alpha n=1 Tax=Lederbergia citrisecunda TaxID=2833583 RepID=UPI003D2993F3